MQLGVRRDDAAAVEAQRFAGVAGDASARLTHDQRTRCDVPWRQTAFPHAVEAAHGDVAQVQGRGAVAPDALCAHEELMEQRQVPFRELAHVVGETRHEQCILDRGDRADVDRLAVARRAPAGGGGEQLLAHRIVDRACGHRSVHLDADRDAEERIVVREVRGAIERIADPAHPCIAATGVRTGLLGQDRVLRETLADTLEQQGLGTFVELGHEIDAAFLLGGVHAPVARAQDRAGFAGERFGRGAQGLRVDRGHVRLAALWRQNMR